MVQMPALNTPQFGWVKIRLPQKAQPVPPIYQPEVAAEAIYWAAHHRRREVFVGSSTVIAIEGNKLAAWLGDWYLGRTGYASQQTNEARDPDAPDNLWHPVDNDHDHGAHGTFDLRANYSSTQLWADTHRAWLGSAGVGVAGVGLAATAALLRRGRS